jgi:hypothetical protein
MPLYRLSRTKIGHPLKEEGAKNGTEPEVIVSTSMTLYKLSLHAYQHGRTPIKNVFLQILKGTMHVFSRGLVKGCGSSNLPDQD